jgi:hypothetical protein
VHLQKKLQQSQLFVNRLSVWNESFKYLIDKEIKQLTRKLETELKEIERKLNEENERKRQKA